jgi:type VI protein secretion system component VasK
MPDEGRSFGQILIYILIGLLALLFIIGVPTFLYWLGDNDASALERLRDVVIVLMGLLWLIIILLLAVMVFVMVWVAFQIKNRALPMLEEILVTVKATSSEATETVKRARGTAEFVSEQIATPVITTVAKVARWRTTARMFVTGNKKKRK